MSIAEYAEPDPIGLAEKILALLEQGRFTATYKYAALLGVMDLCLEQTGADGTDPTHLTTRDLAVKVIELYWPHTVSYAPAGGAWRSCGRTFATQAVRPRLSPSSSTFEIRRAGGRGRR